MKRAASILVLGLVVWPVFSALGEQALSQGVITIETTPYPVKITANSISSWQKEGVRVFAASGDVWITQGKVLITANNAACWFYEQEALSAPLEKEARMEVYCEGDITLVQDKDVQHYEQLFVCLETMTGLVISPYSGKVQTFEEEQPIGFYLQGAKIKEQRRGEFTSREPVIQVTKEPGIVDIVADDIDSWEEEDKRIVTALGNVVVQRDDITLEADNVLLWFEKEKGEEGRKQVFKELYAEGDVTLLTREDVVKADKVFQNVVEKKGIFINPRIKTKLMKPTPPQDIYFGGEVAKQLDQYRTVIKNGYFTTCSFGHPHYRFKSRNVTITRRRTPTESYSEVVARHDTFLIGDFPVAYWPKYTYDTRTKPSVFRGVGWGGSDRLGTVVTTTWAPLNLGLFSGLQRWSDLIVKADYYTMRGPAVGSEFTYERPSLEGTLETFYLKDKAERDKQPGTPLVKHENRGRVLWRHRQYPFGEKEWRVDAELSYLSDRSFLREFYEPEFKTGKEQETDLYVRRLRDNEGATLLLKKRINKFQTQTEAMPLLSYQRISQPLWEDRLNFTSQSEVGYLDTKIDDELNVTDPTTFTRLQRTTGNSVRFDSNNTIGWPFQLWIFKMKPFVGGRVTAYSKSLKDQGPNDGPAVGRLATLLGMDASTSFWRVYSLESKLLRIHRLRHIVTPEFRWEVAPTVTKDPDDLLQTVTGGPANLLQYGLADGMDTYNSLVFGVRNRLQTQRGTPKTTVDLLDLDLEVHLLPKRNDTNKLVTHTVGNAEGFLIPKRDSFLQYDLRSQITDRISVVSERNEFNLDKFTFDVLNFGINFKRTPEWSHFVGFRHLNDISSTLILGTNLVLGEKWGLNFSEVYDFRSESVTGKTSSRNLATGVSLYRKAHDYTGIFTLNFDVANRNTSIKFDILPTGFKKPVGRRYSF